MGLIEEIGVIFFSFGIFYSATICWMVVCVDARVFILYSEGHMPDESPERFIHNF